MVFILLQGENMPIPLSLVNGIADVWQSLERHFHAPNGRVSE